MPSQKPVVSAARTRALRDELARSHETQGVPGTAVAFERCAGEMKGDALLLIRCM